MKSTPSALEGVLDAAPMTSRQYLLLGIALLLAALDGYDALSMAFVAPAISHDWALDKGVVGLLLSSSLVGMAIGSLALSPLADVIGRRPVVLLGLMLLTVGSLLSALAHTADALIGFRAITGVGIGVMIAMTTLLSAEFSNLRRRALAVAGVATIGFPLGGIVGGLAASALLRSAGWPWIFYLGAVAGATMFVLLFTLLPEAPAFIVSRRPSDMLSKLNRSLASLGQSRVDAVPLPGPVIGKSYGVLFGPGMAKTTVRLIAINLLLAMAAYYLLNWLPQLVTDAGYPPATGSMVSAISGILGLGGGLLMGALASRVAPARLAIGTMGGMALGLAAIGLAPPTLVALIIAGGGFLGFPSRARLACFTAFWPRSSLHLREPRAWAW